MGISPLLFDGIMTKPDPEGYFLEKNEYYNGIEKLPE